MADNSCDTEALLRRAREGGSDALGELILRYSGRLRAMVDLRLDRRLAGRVDASDVLQETFLDAARAFAEYREQPDRSFYVWLRCIAERRLVDIHRQHLGVQARDPRREVSLSGWPSADATSAAIAARILGSVPSPSEAAVGAERAARLAAALDTMDRIDKEVLALRHFEQLSNAEAAQVLRIGESAASKRHLRALERLKEALKSVRGDD